MATGEKFLKSLLNNEQIALKKLIANCKKKTKLPERTRQKNVVMCGKYSANFLIVYHVRKFLPHSDQKWQQFPHARNTKIQKICELRKAIFSVFYNISRQILLLLKGSFREFCFLPRSKTSV